MINIKHLKLFLILVIVATAFAGCAGKEYKKTKKDFINYKTSEFYKGQLKSYTIKTNTYTDKKDEDPAISDLLSLKNKKTDEMKNLLQEKRFFDFSVKESYEIKKSLLSGNIQKKIRKKVHLETLINIAFFKNPKIKAFQKGWEASLQKYTQAQMLNNILNQYRSFFNNKMGGMVKANDKNHISNNFPFPGNFTLYGDIADKEIKIKREKYLSFLNDLIRDIKLSYFKLIYVSDSITIIDENLKLLKSLESVVTSKYSTGMVSFNDLIALQIEIEKLSVVLENKKAFKMNVEAKIVSLIGLDNDIILGLPEKVFLPEFDTEVIRLKTYAKKNNLNIILKEVEIEKAALAIKLAKTKFYPDYISTAYLNSNAEFNLKPQINMNFWFGANDSYVREGEIKLQMLNSQLLDLYNNVSYTVEKLQFMLERDLREITLYENNLISKAKTAMDISVIDYEAGKTDFLTVLYSQKALHDFNLNFVSAVFEYNKTITKLTNVLGASSLEVLKD